MIERDELCRRIPHGGSMCLLDRVLKWNNRRIICEAVSHRDKSNPLSCDGALSSVVAIEYGAQAMAIHGSMLAENNEIAGQASYLAAVHDVEFKVSWLHDIDHPVTIRAERLIGGAKGIIYQFSLHALSRLLVQGRVTVMMSAQQHQR
ncbi:hypothetical protein BMS3Abin11_02407 [bacterium BMS3Abin11]|nr:hypothetical protein BMS3Abin11_02407 [bacterium BMS3Abin11]GMT41233.1 MAG: phosphotransferase [bacterium]